MPWEYRYESRRDFFIFHATGVFSEDDLIRGSSAVANDPSLRPDSRVFLDYSAVDEFRISPAAVQALNAQEAVRNIRGKHAFLIFAPRGSQDFHRYLWSLCSSSWFRMFTSRHEAYEWLNEGLSPDRWISGGPWSRLSDLDAGLLDLDSRVGT